MRKFLIVVGIVAVLIIVALLVVPSFLNVNRYHDQIQAELQKRLGRQVSLGQMHLSLLPPAFRVDNAVIGEDPNFPSNRPFANTRELYVTAAFWPLLHGNVEINSLDLRQPKIELIRNQQGVWNFSSLGHNATAPTTAAAKPAPPAQKQKQAQVQQSEAQQAQQKPKEFSLGSLKITDGQVAITDLQKRQARAVYDHIDLALNDFAPGKPFSLDAAAHLPGTGNELLEISGTAGPINSGDMTATPFDGDFKLDEVSLAGVQKFLNSQALSQIGGIASGKASLKNDKGVISTKGSLRLDQAVIKGNSLGYPIVADFNLTDDLNSDLLKISKADLKLGSTPVDIAGTMNMKPTPAQLDMSIKTGNVSIGEAARLAAVFGVAFNPKMKIDGNMQADLHATGAASSPQLNGSLNGSNLQMSGDNLAQPVSVKAINLALTPQEIRSNQFDATTGSTTVGMQFALANYSTPGATIDATVRTDRANLGEVLNIAKAYGVSAVEGMSGSGTLGLNVHAIGPLKGNGAFTYSGNGMLQNATLNMPSLGKPLQVRNADLNFTRDSAVLNNLNASLGQTNATGTMTLRNFTNPQVQFTLNADKVNVAEWQQMMKMQPAGGQAANTAFAIVPRAQAAAPGTEPIIQRMTGTGVLNVGTVLYDQLVLTNARSNVTLDHGIIRLAPITANLYGGQQTGAITIDMHPTPAVYTVDTKLANVDANKLLSSVSSMKQLYGLLAANAATHFTVPTNASSAQIARSLNGNLNLDLIKGRLQGMDILYELSNIGHFLQGTPSKGFTDIVKLAGTFNVVNGVATTNNLQAAIDGGTLAATGSTNLADQSLNMHLTAVLSKAMSQQVGGTQIGGFMNTALANQNGELVIPILVTGTMNAPRFAPDLQKIAQMKLQNMVPTLGNPGAMTQGILGAILGQKKPGTQGPAGQQGQQGGIGGILGGILGGQQQQQQQRQPVGTPTQPQQPPPPQQQQRQQQQQQNPWSDILGNILGGQKKPAQQQQQQQQQQNQQQQPPPPPQ